MCVWWGGGGVEMRKTGDRLGWCLVGWGVRGGGWLVGVDEVAA